MMYWHRLLSRPMINSSFAKISFPVEASILYEPQLQKKGRRTGKYLTRMILVDEDTSKQGV